MAKLTKLESKLRGGRRREHSSSAGPGVFAQLPIGGIAVVRRQDRSRGALWIAAGLIVVALVLAPSAPATVPNSFAETQFATGLNGPTTMAFAPDGRLFVAEQGGKLRVIKNGSLLQTPFLSLSVDSSGERGLLGVAFDPAFASNRFVYVYYTVPRRPCTIGSAASPPRATSR